MRPQPNCRKSKWVAKGPICQFPADRLDGRLVAGICGIIPGTWMTRELARIAGRAKSPAKAAAARKNGGKAAARGRSSRQ